MYQIYAVPDSRRTVCLLMKAYRFLRKRGTVSRRWEIRQESVFSGRAGILRWRQGKTTRQREDSSRTSGKVSESFFQREDAINDENREVFRTAAACAAVIHLRVENADTQISTPNQPWRG